MTALAAHSVLWHGEYEWRGALCRHCVCDKFERLSEMAPWASVFVCEALTGQQRFISFHWTKKHVRSDLLAGQQRHTQWSSVISLSVSRRGLHHDYQLSEFALAEGNVTKATCASAWVHENSHRDLRQAGGSEVTEERWMSFCLTTVHSSLPRCSCEMRVISLGLHLSYSKVERRKGLFLNKWNLSHAFCGCNK